MRIDSRDSSYRMNEYTYFTIYTVHWEIDISEHDEQSID